MYYDFKGVYIAVKPNLTSEALLKEFINKHIEAQINTELHSTLIYSKKKFKGEMIIKPGQLHIAKIKGYALFGPNNDTLVAELDCPTLVARNKELMEKYGFITDFPDYKPHITLAFYAEDTDLDKLPLFDKGIILTNEYVNELEEDWKPQKESLFRRVLEMIGIKVNND